MGIECLVLIYIYIFVLMIFVFIYIYIYIYMSSRRVVALYLSTLGAQYFLPGTALKWAEDTGAPNRLDAV